MRLVKLNPPGTILHHEAIMQMVGKIGGSSFIEVGCGNGQLSARICRQGWSGIGVDYSEPALLQAADALKEKISSGQYRLVKGDLMNGIDIVEKVDLAISIMVMEHVEDHQSFVKKMTELVKPGGHVIIAVPGRRDYWCIEDETVGHLRRYDRQDLEGLLARSGLQDIELWSVGVPTANLLFHLGNFIVSRSKEMEKVNNTKHEQTVSSGVREIPFKTVFPSVFRLILNRWTLYPLIVLQKLFYCSNFGIILMSSARRAM